MLLVEVRSILSGMHAEGLGATSQQSTSLCAEPAEVYYRFRGATLASMYKERYKMMKSPSCSQKNDVGKELTVLDWIRLEDKLMIPKSLQYKDEVGMHFPEKCLIPFIIDVDSCVREHANEIWFAQHGNFKTISF